MPLLACANGEPTSSPDHFGRLRVGHRVVASRGRRPRRQPPLPGQRVEVAAERQRGRREHHRGAAEQPLAQQPADPQRSGVQHLVPVGAHLGQPDDVVALRRIRLVERLEQPGGGVEHLVQRGLGDLAAGRGVRAPPGARRPAPCGTRPRRRAPPTAPRTRAAGARPSGRAAGPRARGRGLRPPRPAGRPMAWSISLPSLRAAAATAPALSSAVATPVTRSTSSCASSTTTTSCSGSTGRPSMRVDGEQRVVGDDDVGPPGLGAGALGEALVADGALGRAEALPRGDRRPAARCCRARRGRARRGRRSRCRRPTRGSA